jgi:hypothetical protein
MHHHTSPRGVKKAEAFPNTLNLTFFTHNVFVFILFGLSGTEKGAMMIK